MSDAAVMPISFTALASRRSAFTPMRALSLRAAEPATVIGEYARGLADGQQLVAAAFAAEKDALLALLASARALKSDAGPELSLLLRETVVRLVEQICGRAHIDADFLHEQIAAATAIITQADEARQIFLHPDDAALVGSIIQTLRVQGDDSLKRGTIRIDCSQGWIEHGVAVGLGQLRGLLGVSA